MGLFDASQRLQLTRLQVSPVFNERCARVCVVVACFDAQPLVTSTRRLSSARRLPDPHRHTSLRKHHVFDTR